MRYLLALLLLLQYSGDGRRRSPLELGAPTYPLPSLRARRMRRRLSPPARYSVREHLRSSHWRQYQACRLPHSSPVRAPNVHAASQIFRIREISESGFSTSLIKEFCGVCRLEKNRNAAVSCRRQDLPGSGRQTLPIATDSSATETGRQWRPALLWTVCVHTRSAFAQVAFPVIPASGVALDRT